MKDLMESVEECTELASVNSLEVLLFSLGKERESGDKRTFGINIFNVREVIYVPEITGVADMPDSVEGTISLWGITIPVINLPAYCGIKLAEKPATMIVTEYNKHMQGFLVHSVDCIQRLVCKDIKAPPRRMADRYGGLVTAVTEVAEKGPIMILDIGKVLFDVAGFYDEDSIFEGIAPAADENITVLFVDDSSVARGRIRRTLEEMGVKYISAVNGQHAWEKLNEIAAYVEAEGGAVADKVQLILTDIEMPEMDGQLLARMVKNDARFKAIPVIGHSSLGAGRERLLGEDVDAWVEKFEPRELAGTLAKMMCAITGCAQSPRHRQACGE